MASRKTLLVAAAIVLVVTAALLVPATASKNQTFIVGDDAGWDVGVDYVAWASGKNIKVGDTLEFRPKKRGLDVVLVDEKSFDACVTPDNAPVLSTGEPVGGELVKSGRFFFICNAEGACESGMKVAINIHSD